MNIENLYNRDPNFEQLQKKREQLLSKLPDTVLNKNQDDLIAYSINLSMKNRKENEYFQSKKLKNAKERPDSDEQMIKMLKKFDIDEYSTHFSKDIYDPKKKIGDDSILEDRKMLKPTVPNSFSNRKD